MNEALNPQEIAELKKKGWKDSQIQEAVNDLGKSSSQSELQQSYANTLQQKQAQQQQANSVMANSMYGTNDVNSDLIRWQLELDSILERYEHILRGDKLKFVNGSLMWINAEEDDERIFNDFGVSEIMGIISMYLNRNTILSNYDEETINWKVLDFGNQLSDVIYLKYEEMGLDTYEKRKIYSMLVHEIVDTVHSAYLRALHGMERETLRKNMSQNLIGQIPMAGGNQQPMRGERSLLNPARYILGKYK